MSNISQQLYEDLLMLHGIEANRLSIEKEIFSVTHISKEPIYKDSESDLKARDILL